MQGLHCTYDLITRDLITRQEIIGAKEAQLLFWLKMGFQDTASVTTDNPLATLFNLPLPKNLQGACSQGGVSDPGSM